MTKQLSNSYSAVSTSDLNSDFEYNFDLNPFNYLLEGIHLLVSVPFNFTVNVAQKASARLRRIQEEQSYKQTFRGSACMLK